ncbi:hypothetical protein [Nocardia sp. CA-145437]|uniref:hypothetical protein n=1 Tax=Nocardia sp. CA-145437 TaxID=3239980 RepID=UPI003D96E934
MNMKNRAVRTGLATLALAAALVGATGPAGAEVPLSPATDIATADSGSSALTSGSANIIQQLFTPPITGCGYCN